MSKNERQVPPIELATKPSKNASIEKYRTIILSERDSLRFLQALDSSEQPNEALRRAAENYKRKFLRNH